MDMRSEGGLGLESTGDSKGKRDGDWGRTVEPNGFTFSVE